MSIRKIKLPGQSVFCLVLSFLGVFIFSLNSLAATGEVLSYQKISDTEGNFPAALDDWDQIGRGIASLGDLDGDGVIDMALGAYGDDDGGPEYGALYILFLNRDGTVKHFQKISALEGGLSEPLHEGNRFGRKLASMGDLDADGIPDLAVGVLHDSDSGTLEGAVYILFLNRDGTVKSYQKIGEGKGGFSDPLHEENGFGDSVADLGDINGDGIDDLAVGAQLDSTGGYLRGAVWILFLNRNGTVKAQQKIRHNYGGFPSGLIDDNDRFGAAVASIGDFDGDGVGDMAVSTYLDDDGGFNRGAFWLLFLNPNGTVKAYRKISNTQGGFTGVLDDGDGFGAWVDSLGDMDADGVTDLAVGAYGDNDGGPSRGAVWILFLNADGTVKAHTKISSTQGGFTGTLDDSDGFGTQVTTLGDLNGDGVVDIAVGAEEDDDGGFNRGAAWILFLQGQAANQPPTANAGMDQTVHAGTSVTMDGSGSSDADGNYPLTYLWEITAKPQGSSAALSDSTIVNPAFTADLLGDYALTLRVTDSLGAFSEADEMIVSTSNTAPVADAGADQMIVTIGSTVQLNGSQSFDIDGDDFTYLWAIISKPVGSSAALNDPSLSAPAFVADVHGEYMIRLIVTDELASASELDTVTVSFDNLKPVAEAGGNQSVVAGDTVFLDGSGSLDANLDPLTYIWSIVSKPDGSLAALSDPSSVATSFITDLPGTYVMSLIVNDGFVNGEPNNLTVAAISLQDALTERLQNAVTLINNLSDSEFKNRNMKKTLTNKINAVLVQMEQGLLSDARDKLQNDILKKTDGCAQAGNPDANDWIITCAGQSQVYPLIIQAIQLLSGL